MQSLCLGDTFVNVDMIFSDAGESALRGLDPRGGVVVTSPGRSPAPTIGYQEQGHVFFYLGPKKELVAKLEDIAHLNNPSTKRYYDLAKAQVERLQAGEVVKGPKVTKNEDVAARMANMRNAKLAKKNKVETVVHRGRVYSGSKAIVDDESLVAAGATPENLTQLENTFGPRASAVPA